jgi:hypothetical protein
VGLEVVATVLGNHPHLGRIGRCPDCFVVVILVVAVTGLRAAVVVASLSRRAVCRSAIVVLRSSAPGKPNDCRTASQLEHPSTRE